MSNAMSSFYRSQIEPFFRHPRILLCHALKRGLFNWMNDEQYLKFIWLIRMGYPLDLNNPRTFNEKLQWLKLHDHNPQYTIMADKYEAKKFIAERVGEEYVVPNYGVWDSFDEIDFDALPEQFVLKTTHDNDSVFIVKDRDIFDKASAKRLLEKHLKINHFWWWREWAYKNIKPRIIAEKLLIDNNNTSINDYKFFCFNGIPKFNYVCHHVSHGQNPVMTQNDGSPEFTLSHNLRPLYRLKNLMGHLETYTFYDSNYNKIMCSKADWPATVESEQPPLNFDKMKEIAAILSQGIPHVRVDFYEINGQLYVGELTFYTSAGYEDFAPDEYNYKFGDMITLPEPNA